MFRELLEEITLTKVLLFGGVAAGLYWLFTGKTVKGGEVQYLKPDEFGELKPVDPATMDVGVQLDNAIAIQPYTGSLAVTDVQFYIDNELAPLWSNAPSEASQNEILRAGFNSVLAQFPNQRGVVENAWAQAMMNSRLLTPAEVSLLNSDYGYSL